MRYDERLTSFSTADLHALRIACKRVRYAAEVLAEICPDRLSSLLRQTREMQGLLGAVHDADVFAERVRQFARRCRLPAAGGAGGSAAAARTMLVRLRRRRIKALRNAV